MSFEQKARERIEELKKARKNLVSQFEQINAAIGELEAVLEEDDEDSKQDERPAPTQDEEVS